MVPTIPKVKFYELKKCRDQKYYISVYLFVVVYFHQIVCQKLKLYGYPDLHNFAKNKKKSWN